MRRLTPLVRAWALLALATLASAEPLLAQDAQPESVTGSRAATPDSKVRIVTPFRRRVLDQAPPSFVRHARDLRPIQRRKLERSMRRMSEPQRRRFYRDWERMSVRERDQAMGSFIQGAEPRRRRELPSHLRTPEIRERLSRMSPEERHDFFARAQDWRELSAGERRHMRARLARFGELGESEQQALVDAKFARKSPEERARILRDLREASRQQSEQRATRAAAALEPQQPPPPATETPAHD